MQKVRIRFAYKQGFRRLWAIVSILYLAVVCAFNWDVPEPIKVVFLLGIIPVVAMYLFGMICVWIIEGFARADH